MDQFFLKKVGKQGKQFQFELCFNLSGSNLIKHEQFAVLGGSLHKSSQE